MGCLTNKVVVTLEDGRVHWTAAHFQALCFIFSPFTLISHIYHPSPTLPFHAYSKLFGPISYLRRMSASFPHCSTIHLCSTALRAIDSVIPLFAFGNFVSLSAQTEAQVLVLVFVVLVSIVLNKQPHSLTTVSRISHIYYNTTAPVTFLSRSLLIMATFNTAARGPRTSVLMDNMTPEEWRIMEEVTSANSIAYMGFRWHSPSTQAIQDHHLEMYLRYIRNSNPAIPNETPLDDVTLTPIAFPDNEDALIKNCRFFLITIFKITKPRSIVGSRTIAYSTLMTYRASLVFWIPRKLDQQHFRSVEETRLFLKMTEVMKGVWTQYGDHAEYAVKESVLIGMPELIQLLDYETYSNVCIEVSEQHMAAWCLGRFTACRPGSLGDSRHRVGHMQLKDLTITRGREPGMFDMVVTFRHLKTNSVDPEKAAVQNTRTVKCYLRCPISAYITVSFAHRVLAMLLRRKALQDFETVDELLNSEKMHIKVECFPSRTGIDDANKLFRSSKSASKILCSTRLQSGGSLSTPLAMPAVALSRNLSRDVVERWASATTSLSTRFEKAQPPNLRKSLAQKELEKS